MYSLAADSPTAKGGVDNIKIQIQCVAVGIFFFFFYTSSCKLCCCIINNSQETSKLQPGDICQLYVLFISSMWEKKKLKTAQSVSWNKCLFDFGLIWREISLEAENTSQRCWKSPPSSMKHTVCCDSHHNHVNNLTVFQGTYEDTLQSGTVQYSTNDTRDTHSARFYSCVSAVAAPLSSPPPSLFAFVQCYTAGRENMKTYNWQCFDCACKIHRKRNTATVRCW